jgi:hypothetical protein
MSRTYNRGQFVRGDHRINRQGRKKGYRLTYAYRCPFCRGPIGPVRERRLTKLTEEQVKRLAGQMVRRNRHRVPRAGRGRFEKGLPDPARNRSGRPLYSRDKLPKVPAYCRHCQRRIRPEVARVLKSHYRSRLPE